MTTDPSSSRRFDVALSFPGEHRPFVKKVAEHLAATFGEARVLYDKWYEHEFASIDLDVDLPNLYRTQLELIVLFLCPEYAAKRWCGLELRYIRDLIGTPDKSRIMPLHYGEKVGDFTKLGILRGDCVMNYEGRPPRDRGAYPQTLPLKP